MKRENFVSVYLLAYYLPKISTPSIQEQQSVVPSDIRNSPHTADINARTSAGRKTLNVGFVNRLSSGTRTLIIDPGRARRSVQRSSSTERRSFNLPPGKISIDLSPTTGRISSITPSGIHLFQELTYPRKSSLSAREHTQSSHFRSSSIVNQEQLISTSNDQIKIPQLEADKIANTFTPLPLLSTSQYNNEAIHEIGLSRRALKIPQESKIHQDFPIENKITGPTTNKLSIPLIAFTSQPESSSTPEQHLDRKSSSNMPSTRSFNQDRIDLLSNGGTQSFSNNSQLQQYHRSSHTLSSSFSNDTEPMATIQISTDEKHKKKQFAKSKTYTNLPITIKTISHHHSVSPKNKNHHISFNAKSPIAIESLESLLDEYPEKQHKQQSISYDRSKSSKRRKRRTKDAIPLALTNSLHSNSTLFSSTLQTCFKRLMKNSYFYNYNDSIT